MAESVGYSGAAAAPARAKARPKGSLAAEPVDREDAIERVASAARFWRTEDPYSPAPYLMLRGMRWGELRAVDTLDPSTFEAPDSETRTSLEAVADRRQLRGGDRDRRRPRWRVRRVARGSTCSAMW